MYSTTISGVMTFQKVDASHVKWASRAGTSMCVKIL